MKAQIVSFHCVLKNKLGQILSSSFNRDVINQLDQSSREYPPRLPGLVASLQNVHEGEKRKLTVSAQEAYGLYDPSLVVEVPRSQLSGGDELQIGSEVVGKSGPGADVRVHRVIQIIGDTLVLDANHPLAGQDLTFEIEITSARDACQEDFEEPLISASTRTLH